MINKTERVGNNSKKPAEKRVESKEIDFHDFSTLFLSIVVDEQPKREELRQSTHSNKQQHNRKEKIFKEFRSNDFAENKREKQKKIV